MELNLNEAILRLILAVLLGSFIGLERELSHQSAGLRTHILVCLGAAAFTIVSISDMTRGLAMTGPTVTDIHYNHDPGRIAAQVIAGIGFIGGGAVLRHGNSVRGITTAASLWMMASIGMLCGIGQYYLAAVTAFFSFLTLFTIGAMERNFLNKNLRHYNRMRVQVTVLADAQDAVHHWFEQQFGIGVVESKSERDLKKHLVTLIYHISLNGGKTDVNKLTHQINTMIGVTSCNVRLFHEETPS